MFHRNILKLQNILLDCANIINNYSIFDINTILETIQIKYPNYLDVVAGIDALHDLIAKKFNNYRFRYYCRRRMPKYCRYTYYTTVFFGNKYKAFKMWWY